MLALGLVVGFGCGDDETPTNNQQDMGVDISLDQPSDLDPGEDMSDMPWTPRDRYPTQDGVDPDGVDVNVPANDGQSRVGRAGSDSGGFTGLWAHCRPGDFVMYNAQARYCVQAETTNLQEMFTGGMIVDAELVGSDADDRFALFNPKIGFNAQLATSVEIVRDGSDGGPAVIRVEGRDYAMAYLVGVVGDALFRPQDLDLTTEYRLYPDTTEMEVITWVKNVGSVPRNVDLGDWYGFSDRVEPFREEFGLNTTLMFFDYLLSRTDDGANFSYRGEKPIKLTELPFSEAAPWLLVDQGQFRIEEDQEVSYMRWMDVGDGRMETLRDRMLTTLEREPDRVAREIEVVDDNGNPVVGRRVTVSKDGVFLLTDKTIADGKLPISLEPGTYTVEVAPGFGGVPTTGSVDLSQDAVIRVPPVGTLRAELFDGSARPTGLVKVLGIDGAEFFAIRGTGEIELEVGSYSVVASRGLEYDVVVDTVDINANELTTWQTQLNRTVDTDGWLSGDFHQHMEPSTDSSVRVEDRVLDNIAEGVEFVASTDHDVVTDLQPIIDALGMQDQLATFPGVEISPTTSHQGVYPIEYDRMTRGNNTIPLAYLEDGEIKRRLIPDIFAAARAIPSQPLIQLNHPRGSSSLFETVDYEPTEDPRTFEDELWSTDFDTIEIVNRISSTCRIYADWSTFHNVGLHKTGLGNSDTHDLKGDPAGAIRNYMPIPKTPNTVTDDDVKTALKEGRVTVGKNAFMDFTDGKLPADMIPATAAQDITFGVRVQTANWSQAEKLFVVVNGSIVQEIDRTGTNGNDFDETITLSFTQDSWVSFFAHGPNPQTQADYGGPTLAFSNAIFVDVDNDGWTPPGVLPLNLDAINVDGWCE